MKKWTVAVASLLILSLAATAFAQKPPRGARQAPDKHGESEMEEPGEGPMARRRGPLGPGAEDRNPAAEKEAMDYLKAQVPEMDEELERLQKDRPEIFQQKFRHYMMAYRDPKMRDEVIKGLKSDFQVRRLVKAVREAKGDEKEKVKKDLEKALSEQFDSNLARMEARLKRMQEEIGELKARIEKRRSVKDQIVKKRVGELTGEVETWDW